MSGASSGRMRLHVINLARRPDRRVQFFAWNGRDELDIEFVDAVDGAGLDRTQLRADGLLGTDTDRWSAGAIGNALSHHALWLRAMRQDVPTLICEDDACLRGDFASQAGKVMAGMDVPWDVVFFGYNTDTFVPTQTRDGLITLIAFDEGAKAQPGYFERFRRTRAPTPAPMRCHQVWGTLCCAVTPKGAARLLDTCFPLDGARDIRIAGKPARVKPYTIDSMINLALQAGALRGFCVFPPLAVSANQVGDSDVVSA